MKNKIYLCMCLIIYCSCSDNVDMQEADLDKYPWLASFLVSDVKNFEGIHNTDIGTIQFSYTLSLSNKDSILNLYDRISQNDSWFLVDSSANGREYSKALHEIPADTGQTIIKIELDTIDKRIRFTIK